MPQLLDSEPQSTRQHMDQWSKFKLRVVACEADDGGQILGFCIRGWWRDLWRWFCERTEENLQIWRETWIAWWLGSMAFNGGEVAAERNLWGLVEVVKVAVVLIWAMEVVKATVVQRWWRERQERDDKLLVFFYRWITLFPCVTHPF